jgi:hypothetical protein
MRGMFRRPIGGVNQGSGPHFSVAAFPAPAMHESFDVAAGRDAPAAMMFDATA